MSATEEGTVAMLTAWAIGAGYPVGRATIRADVRGWLGVWSEATGGTIPPARPAATPAPARRPPARARARSGG